MSAGVSVRVDSQLWFVGLLAGLLAMGCDEVDSPEPVVRVAKVPESAVSGAPSTLGVAAPSGSTAIAPAPSASAGSAAFTSASVAPVQQTPPPGSGLPAIRFADLPGDGSYEAHITYPVLKYEDTKLSARVKRKVQQLVLRRKREVERSFAFDREESVEDVGMWWVDACSLLYASKRLVSIGCDSYYFGGGAHGSKGFRTLNLRLPEVREIRLTEVLRFGPAVRSSLISLCDDSLASQAHLWRPRLDRRLDEEFPSRGAIAFKTFGITQVGLVFYFKDQLPHVNADVVVPRVSWSDLEPLLTEKGKKLVSSREPHVSAEAPYGPWDHRG